MVAEPMFGWVEIIRIKAISVRLALNLPTGTELGKNKSFVVENIKMCSTNFHGKLRLRKN